MYINKRDSNFELLRIVSMVFIITSHYVIHNNLIDNSLNFSGILAKFISIAANVGVNSFILISGYFLSKSDFSLRKYIYKIKKIILQVWVYSIVIFIVFIIFSNQKISIEEVLKSTLPILFSQYWFATTYIIMFILYPFLNIFIENVSKDMYKLLLVLLFIITSLIPTILPIAFVGNEIIWFIFLYLTSAYLQKYKADLEKIVKVSKWLFIGMYICIFLSTIFISYLSLKYTVLESQIRYFTFRNKVPVFLCSVALFLYFSNIKIGDKKYINIISSTTFGIYLIHDNLFMRRYIWDNVLKVNYYWGNKYMLVHILISVLMIFIICMLIELIRQKMFNYLEIKYKSRGRGYVKKNYSQNYDEETETI